MRNVIHKLRDQGNSVVVVEHKLDAIKTADQVVDTGPAYKFSANRLNCTPGLKHD